VTAVRRAQGGGAESPVLELAGVSKDYRGLRPLRIHELVVRAGERVALVGLDRISAEVLVNLLTGATLPDAGRIALFGRATAEITDSADWFSFVDRFGIVSERAVLLEQLTVLQNLAMPFTLQIEPMADAERARAEALAQEVGLSEAVWNKAVAALDQPAKTRIRFGRALALDPAVLLLEQVSAGMPAEDASALALDVAASAGRRGAALVAATVDEPFAKAVASRVLRWDAASGRLSERRGWLGGRLG
jgi:predicted ABC-type transport system involved in lysophospholipase L1 biosynthesis ATPase subunit